MPLQLFLESTNISLYPYQIYVYAKEMLALYGQNSHWGIHANQKKEILIPFAFWGGYYNLIKHPI